MNNIPIPPARISHRKYNFDDLEVDQSKLFPKEKAVSVRVRACLYAKKTGKQMATRVMKNGIRVWRLS